MGLPRFVANELDAYAYKTRDTILVDALCAGAQYGHRVFEILNRCKKSGADGSLWLHVTWCLIRSRWADFGFRQFRLTCPDNMDRVPSKLYVGLEQSPAGALLCEWRSVTIPLYFMKRLEQLNSEREARDRAEVKLAAQIALLRDKIYVSRCFPSRLRFIIFERDKYRCQICLRNKETLAGLGRHLEVDHISPFIDGGKTTYSNGMTVCNECNIAKHHAKGYLRNQRELEG
jgi:5-methylcytosine-specific restriction endonuclease McrA